jgi:hypothetical protein
MEINKKYELLNRSLIDLTKDNFNLLIVKGLSGFGKSFAISKFLDDNKIEHTIINYYTSPLKFYQILYENKDKTVICFDDVQSISDKKVADLIKQACWSVLKDRRIGYASTSKIVEKLNLPDTFELKANIILIFNDNIKGYEPIYNRGIVIDFNFDYQEKLKIFEEIVGKGIDLEVFDYVKTFCSPATKNLSIRTLVILSNIKKAGSDWIKYAQEILKTDESIIWIVQGLSEKDWCNKTGKSRRSYYYLKQKYINS